MQTADKIQLALAIIQTVTLGFIACGVIVASRQARASNELVRLTRDQLEAAYTPVLSAKAIGKMPPYGLRVRIENSGNGIARNVVLLSRDEQIELGFITPGTPCEFDLNLQHTLNYPDRTECSIKYESLTGTAYVTDTSFFPNENWRATNATNKA